MRSMTSLVAVNEPLLPRQYGFLRVFPKGLANIAAANHGNRIPQRSALNLRRVGQAIGHLVHAHLVKFGRVPLNFLQAANSVNTAIPVRSKREP